VAGLARIVGPVGRAGGLSVVAVAGCLLDTAGPAELAAVAAAVASWTVAPGGSALFQAASPRPTLAGGPRSAGCSSPGSGPLKFAASVDAALFDAGRHYPVGCEPASSIRQRQG